MIIGIAHVALLVKEYDEAIDFYCNKLGFKLIEDTPMGHKRWVRIEAPGLRGSEILLSRAADDEQRAFVGKQAGGRVLFFFHTNNFDSDYELLCSKGVEFTEPARKEAYGKVAVFKDLYGNRIDFIEFSTQENVCTRS